MRAAQPHSGRSSMVISLSIEPDRLDPTMAPSAAVGEVTHYNVLEGLTQITENGAVQPLLAESFVDTVRRAQALGVLGAGHIGRQVIRIAQAMEMNVLAATRTPRPDEAGIRYVSREEMLRESDFITLHCPLNEKTHHVIDASALSLMKPTAFLINTSRGALIDEQALIKALQEHQIAGAGLDVQEQEPPAADNPLYTMSNVILTPHMGWKGMETRQRLVSIIAEDIHQFMAGTPVNVVG